MNALIYPEGGVKGHRPDMIVVDGGDTTILIHEGKKADDLFLKDGTIPDPRSTENAQFKIVQTTINRQLESAQTYK